MEFANHADADLVPFNQLAIQRKKKQVRNLVSSGETGLAVTCGGRDGLVYRLRGS
jgi:hypothetical protein